MAGVVIVAECETGDAVPECSIPLASPKSRTLTVPSGRTLMRGLQIAVDDPLLVRRLQRLGDLSRDAQCVADGDRATRDALRQILPLDQLHHERTHAARCFEAVNARCWGD
jgi:hypothetical protein